MNREAIWREMIMPIETPGVYDGVTRAENNDTIAGTSQAVEKPSLCHGWVSFSVSFFLSRRPISPQVVSLGFAAQSAANLIIVDRLRTHRNP